MIEVSVHGNLSGAIKAFEQLRVRSGLVSDLRRHESYIKPSTARRIKRWKGKMRSKRKNAKMRRKSQY